MSTVKNESGAKVKSLQKALDVLNCFLVKQPLGVTEISEMLNIYKSNVHNILSTFLALEYVEKDPESEKYSLGIGVYRLSRALGERFSLDKLVQPYVRELANRINESVVVSVPVGKEVLFVGGEHPDIEGVYTRLTYIGTTSKMHCTGTGKAMLAFMTPSERDICLDGELEALTEHTITDRAEMLAYLEKVRDRGYATDHMEFRLGLSCIAAPLLDAKGRLLGALSITGPTERIEGEGAQRLVRELLACTARVRDML